MKREPRKGITVGPKSDVAFMSGAEWQLTKVYAALRVLIPSPFNFISSFSLKTRDSN